MTKESKSLSPLVSIIIRTKNEERWIDHCLRAIETQKFRDYEIILVDNNSEDRSVKVARKYTEKIISVTDFFTGKAINEYKSFVGKVHCYNIWTFQKIIFGLKINKTTGERQNWFTCRGLRKARAIIFLFSTR